MTFGNGGWLEVLWLLPAAAGLFAWAFWWQRRAVRAMAGTALAPTLAASVNWGRRRWKAALIIAAAGLFIVALARPQWDPREETKRVYVLGFVANMGPVPCEDCMTLGDALTAAGGYGHCDDCLRSTTIENHPTSRYPPTVHRDGMMLKLPREKSEWSQFLLFPGDLVTFHHIGVAM